MPLADDGSTTVMVSVEPSGHTTWNVEPAGKVENGMALLARYTAATWLAPCRRCCSSAVTLVDLTYSGWYR